jgi:putative tryptophan/tyrosine transport system substrate-binding protein
LWTHFGVGLKETGFIEGQNVAIEYRWAFGEANQLPKLAAELVQKPVALFVTTGGESAALAAKATTSSIPIAFIIGGDPVKLGLVATYNRPVGNATGISILTANLEPKRLEFLRELVPQARIGGLLDPNFPPFGAQVRDLREAAHALGVDSKNSGRALMTRSTQLSTRVRSSASAQSWLPRGHFLTRAVIGS